MSDLANVVVSDRKLALARPVGIVIAASLFIAVCARLSFVVPFTPVPLTLANFGVLAVGLVLGSRKGFAAAVGYLAMGVAGMPVFATGGIGGPAQLIGPTGGYLMAYPAVAFVAGSIAERTGRKFGWNLLAATVANALLFVCGVSWLVLALHVSFAQAAVFGLYPFVFLEGMKIVGAAGLATRFRIR
jgi:biotin transport system substrate-specific component